MGRACAQKLRRLSGVSARKKPFQSGSSARRLQDAVALISQRPGVGRQAEWPGLMRWSVPDWNKIIIYREIPDGVRVVALYDARQDLSAVDPTSND